VGGGPGRRLHPAILWRKRNLGSDSEAGSRFAERLLTVVATCRQQGRSLLAFLVAASEAALQGTAAPSLLPTGQGAERIPISGRWGCPVEWLLLHTSVTKGEPT
jgi:hypothetical protein